MNYDDDDGPEISYLLAIHPEGTGVLMNVAIGLGLPALVLQMVEDPDVENSILMKLTTGAPFGQDVEGVNNIADILETWVESLRSEQFQTAWVAKMAEVSETGEEEEEDL